MQTISAVRRTYGAARGEFGESPAQLELRAARRAAEHVRLAVTSWAAGQAHPLAWSINAAWQAGEKAAAAARTLTEKAKVWRALEAKMRSYNVHGAKLAEAVAAQERRIAEIQAETLAKAPKPPAATPPGAREWLAAYRDHGCVFSIDGDELRITAGGGLLAGDMARLREHKAELIALLRAETRVI